MYLELCTPEQMENIYSELGTTKEAVQKDVQDLMDWMEKQPHLPDVRDEEFLTHFLIRCKNSMEKTKRKLEMYYSARALMPEIYSNRNIESEELTEALKTALFTPVPKVTKEGNRLIFLRFFDIHGVKLPTSEVALKGMVMVLDMMLKICNSRSYIIVFDFENMSAPIIALGFTILKKFLTLATKTTPGRFDKIYFVNMMPAAEPLVNIGKTFVKKELADRIVIWKKKSSELSEAIEAEVVPSNYGGKEKPIEELQELWKEFAKVQFKNWLLNEDTVKADLSKKPIGDQLNKDLSMYGVEGSFRNIVID
ncbi:hypothetical protein V9T40_001091 [Parthenolecanium corni]|uniref:CRAL-TRIO domain-containing protein n=1 Tax=Parthenolecanium corni TaxID=536013 RepID=A0AAN9TNL2_9HEMI